MREGPMLKAEEQMELTILKKHGGSIRGLSRSTGRSRNTVRRYLRGGDEVAKRKPGPKRAEKLDAFKTYIVDRMKAALPDRIPATVLFERSSRRTGRRLGAAPTSHRSSLRRSGGAARHMSSSATTSGSRR